LRGGKEENAQLCPEGQGGRRGLTGGNEAPGNGGRNWAKGNNEDLENGQSLERGGKKDPAPPSSRK